MTALLLIGAGVYLFVAGRAQQGRLYHKLDDIMGEQAAGFLFSTLGGGMIAVALLGLISSMIG